MIFFLFEASNEIREKTGKNLVYVFTNYFQYDNWKKFDMDVVESGAYLGGLWGPGLPGVTKGAPKKKKKERERKRGRERK